MHTYRARTCGRIAPGSDLRRAHMGVALHRDMYPALECCRVQNLWRAVVIINDKRSTVIVWVGLGHYIYVMLCYTTTDCLLALLARLKTHTYDNIHMYNGNALSDLLVK